MTDPNDGNVISLPHFRWERLKREMMIAAKNFADVVRRMPEEDRQRLIAKVEEHSRRPWNEMSPRERSRALVDWIMSRAEDPCGQEGSDD